MPPPWLEYDPALPSPAGAATAAAAVLAFGYPAFDRDMAASARYPWGP